MQIINGSNGTVLATLERSFPIAGTDLSTFYMTCSPDGNLYLFYPTAPGNFCLKINTGIAVVNDIIVCSGDLSQNPVSFTNIDHGTTIPRSIAWDYTTNKCFAIYDNAMRIYQAFDTSEITPYSFHLIMVSQSWVAPVMPVGSIINSMNQIRLNICNGFLDNINTIADIQLVSYDIDTTTSGTSPIISKHAESINTTDVVMTEQTTLQPLNNYLTTGIIESTRYNDAMTTLNIITRASTPSLYSNATKS